MDRHIVKMVLVICFVLLGVSVGQARDYVTSDEDLLKIFMPEVESGYTEAMVCVGNVFYFGLQIPQDLQKEEWVY